MASRVPPRARDFSLADLGRLDAAALRTLLDPADGGVSPELLGVALRGCDATLVSKVRRALPRSALAVMDARASDPVSEEQVRSARTDVVGQLFWPLLYWCEPDEYDELISGERINQRLLDEIDLDARVVCDIGTGTGRFALPAARHARRVIAVDLVPQLLRILEKRAREARLTNIETVRAPFQRLPLADASVDVAVACSSFTTHGPHGGARALAEAERIVRTGGDVVVIWPQNVRWLLDRGFSYIAVHSDDSMHFRDVPTAERLCARYYSAAAARWVRDHDRADVPYAVLGVTPPSDLCLKRMK
ncbi:MAG: methyltransferase domain-containing protein [Candidatus Dormibacteraeota bacterium]|nr:methyltransferase domain-containing protein [Candidatus Dormibacteraeota bacterium]MBV9524883.1 methyltransferase domain-containing protein [Candidatus Dormibacteraeota bacterium]